VPALEIQALNPGAVAMSIVLFGSEKTFTLDYITGKNNFHTFSLDRGKFPAQSAVNAMRNFTKSSSSVAACNNASSTIFKRSGTAANILSVL
jgi:hypothetical protein